MMRTVIAMVGGIVMMLYILYFGIPLLNYEKSATASIFNSSDTTISVSQTFGNGFYTALPLMGIIAAVFLVIAIALRYLPGE